MQNEPPKPKKQAISPAERQLLKLQQLASQPGYWGAVYSARLHELQSMSPEVRASFDRTGGFKKRQHQAVEEAMSGRIAYLRAQVLCVHHCTRSCLTPSRGTHDGRQPPWN